MLRFTHAGDPLRSCCRTAKNGSRQDGLSQAGYIQMSSQVFSLGCLRIHVRHSVQALGPPRDHAVPSRRAFMIPVTFAALMEENPKEPLDRFTEFPISKPGTKKPKVRGQKGAPRSFHMFPLDRSRNSGYTLYLHSGPRGARLPASVLAYSLSSKPLPPLPPGKRRLNAPVYCPDL